MMKRLVVVVVALVCVAALAYAMEDVKEMQSCSYCGMDREKFAHSRMLIEYDDGSKMGTCSLHCAAIDLALKMDKSPVMIGVADYNSKKIIDAEKAYWVLGGSKPGVMTATAKWAFETKEDAEKFIQENGGTLATFEDAIKGAYDDMYQDTKMIREKKKKMKGMGHEHHH